MNNPSLNDISIILEFDSHLANRWPCNLSNETVDQLLINGINTQKVKSIADALLKLSNEQISKESRRKARAAIDTCKNISLESNREANALQRIFNSSGIQAHVLCKKEELNSQQIYIFRISIEATSVIQAITLAEIRGFEPWVKRSPAALECYRRTRNSITLIKSDDMTTRMELQWESKAKNSGLLTRLLPSDLDYDFCNLPRSLWQLYYIVRPVRLISQVFSGKSSAKEFNPYLGTPNSIIPELFKAVKLTKNDLIIDLGCGDGRILIEAAMQYDCYGIGIEIDKTLAELAQGKVSEVSLRNKIVIQHEDISNISLKSVTVAFIFLPSRNIPPLLKRLRKDLAKGARIIIHEQAPLDPMLKPNRSIPIFTKNAITVSHIWIVC